MLLTSQRSVESVNKAVSILPVAWNGKRHYCVGIKTGETASTLLGLTNLAGQDCGNADNLSALIVKGTENDYYFTCLSPCYYFFFLEFQDGLVRLPLLFPCSSLKMDTLPRTLKQYDISIDIITSYVTVPHPQLRDSVLKLAARVHNL